MCSGAPIKNVYEIPIEAEPPLTRALPAPSPERVVPIIALEKVPVETAVRLQ